MTETGAIRGFGWKRDRLDWRDHQLTPHPEIVRRVALPARCDLRGPFMPPVYDQGQIGSCVCNASVAAVDFERKKQGEAFLLPSRLWLYYVIRQIEGTPAYDDAGCEIRDAIKVLNRVQSLSLYAATKSGNDAALSGELGSEAIPAIDVASL